MFVSLQVLDRMLVLLFLLDLMTRESSAVSVWVGGARQESDLFIFSS